MSFTHRGATTNPYDQVQKHAQSLIAMLARSKSCVVADRESLPRTVNAKGEAHHGPGEAVRRLKVEAERR